MKDAGKKEHNRCLYRITQVDRELYFECYYCERFGEEVDLEHCEKCEDRVE